MDRFVTTGNIFVRMGLFGLAIFVVLNGFALLVLEQPAAQPFTGKWWSTWFPSGIAWLSLLMVGVALSRSKRSSQS